MFMSAKTRDGWSACLFLAPLSFKTQSLCQNFKKDMALIRGILNTLFTPRKIRGMFSVILWPSDEVAKMGTRWLYGLCLAAMAAGSSLTNLYRGTAFNFTGCFPAFEVHVHFTVSSCESAAHYTTYPHLNFIKATSQCVLLASREVPKTG